MARVPWFGKESCPLGNTVAIASPRSGILGRCRSLSPDQHLDATYFTLLRMSNSKIVVLCRWVVLF